MNRINILCQFRSGSTIICEYLSYCLGFRYYDELFHQNAVIYGHGPHGEEIKKTGEKKYYNSLLNEERYVLKTIAKQIDQHPTLSFDYLFDLLYEKTDCWVILRRRDVLQQLLSFYCVVLIKKYHHRSDDVLDFKEKKIIITEEKFHSFMFDLSLLDKIEKIFHERGKEVINIYYEDVFSSNNPLSKISDIFKVEDRSKEYEKVDDRCRKIGIEYEKYVENIDEIKNLFKRHGY